jgi:prepilin-type N-terminal cleavage/methylation domain-containing protein
MSDAMHTPRKIRALRRGFTLTELLVVIAIILFLAALVVAMLPSIASQTSEAQGAANLQGWLNIARQKAVRNQSPYGLRLWVQNAATMWVTECQYIEQPDDFTGGTLYTQSDGATDVYISGVDVTGGFSAGGDPTLYSVQSGDYLEVLGTGLMHSIAQPTIAIPNPIQYNGGTNTSYIAINTPIPFQVVQTGATSTNYRILRAPRVIGEERLALPTDVIVDLSTNTTYGNPLPVTNLPTGGAYVDVLFSPSGSVITRGLSTSYMALWVRLPDTSNAPGASPANAFAGTPTIIAVWGQTGLVGAYPPVQNAINNPYVDIR